MNLYALYDKALRVIDGCTTVDQWMTAMKWCDRASQIFLDSGTDFGKEARTEMWRKLFRKKLRVDVPRTNILVPHVPWLGVF